MQFVQNTDSTVAWHSDATVTDDVTFTFKNQMSEVTYTVASVSLTSTDRAYKATLNINYPEGMYLVTITGFSDTYLAYIASNPIMSESTFTSYSYDTTDTVYTI